MEVPELLSYATAADVATRIYRAKRIWLHGEPKIKLTGKVGSFGTLTLDFKDTVLEYRIYIKHRGAILRAVHEAVKQFSIFDYVTGTFDEKEVWYARRV